MYSFPPTGQVSDWLAGPSGLEMEPEFHLEPLMRAIAQAHRSQGSSQADVALQRTTLEVLRVIWPEVPEEGHEVLIDEAMYRFRRQMAGVPSEFDKQLEMVREVAERVVNERAD